MAITTPSIFNLKNLGCPVSWDNPYQITSPGVWYRNSTTPISYPTYHADLVEGSWRISGLDLSEALRKIVFEYPLSGKKAELVNEEYEDDSPLVVDDTEFNKLIETM